MSVESLFRCSTDVILVGQQERNYQNKTNIIFKFGTKFQVTHRMKFLNLGGCTDSCQLNMLWQCITFIFSWIINEMELVVNKDRCNYPLTMERKAIIGEWSIVTAQWSINEGIQLLESIEFGITWGWLWSIDWIAIIPLLLNFTNAHFAMHGSGSIKDWPVLLCLPSHPP